MGLGAWFSGLWNKFIGLFNDFMKEVFTQATQIVIGQFKDLASKVVADLEGKDMSSADKRIEAFNLIKTQAEAQGKVLSSSLINLLIELAVQRLKNASV